MTMQQWLRHEWKRSGLPLNHANEACGVASAATRKYLTADHLWYYPPPAAFASLTEFANRHGNPAGLPYFSTDGKQPINEHEWTRYRAKFTCPAGWTNVWRHPQVAGSRRLRGPDKTFSSRYRSLHGSQKPLELIEIAITASTDGGDTVWEPFGGLCPAAVCAFRTGRACRSTVPNHP